MAATSDDRPGILGGQPTQPAGPPDWPGADPDVAAAIQRAGADGSWGRYHGPHSKQLLDRLESLVACRHVILCASGTAAIELALRGVKVGPGDEVILAAYDFKGNYQDVSAVGATPVLVDVDPANWNLAVDGIAEAISPATKAIIASHLHGGTVPMRSVRNIADAAGLAVIEDACQMPGATVDGRPAGTWGDVGVFSFGGSKLLSAGRGGALFTNQAGIAQRVRLYTQRGNEAYPLSELQAAVLVPQLDRLGQFNQRRAAGAKQLVEWLSNIPGLDPFENPATPEPTQPGFYKVGLRYAAAAFDGLSRDLFAAAMRAEGIAVDPGFRSLAAIHSRRRFRAVGELTHAADADARLLVLHHPLLLCETSELSQFVAAVDKVRQFSTIIREHFATGEAERWTSPPDSTMG